MVGQLLDGWVLRTAINSFLNYFIMVNLFVAVWGGETTVFQRAVVAILMESMGVLWSGIGESRDIRRFVMVHFVALLWVSSVIDLCITPIYFYSAYAYFIVFVIALDGIYNLLFMTATNEVREVLITNPNERNSYIPRLAKVRGVAGIIGAIVTMFMPLSEWGHWWMFGGIILCITGTSLTTTFMMCKTRTYMKVNNLVFPSESKDI